MSGIPEDPFVTPQDSFEEINLEKQNLIYQKDFANKITSKINETNFLLTLSLNNHLNFGQNFTINTSEVFMLLEKISINLVLNKQIGNGKINFPSNLNEIENILIRSKLEPLPSFGNYRSNTRSRQ